MQQFKEKVYTAAKRIPRGKVATYKGIARFLGNPKSYRAVGNALNRNPYAPRVPCHRVVRSDGRIGGFAAGPNKKVRLLKSEGVRVRSGKVDLREFEFTF